MTIFEKPLWAVKNASLPEISNFSNKFRIFSRRLSPYFTADESWFLKFKKVEISVQISWLIQNLCNGTDGWTGPLACLSLSSVSWVDKEQLPQSGIRPLPYLFLSQIIDVLRVKKFLWAHFWVQLLIVTTAWNTVETGDKYIWLSRFCTARRSDTGYCRVGPTKVEAYKSLVVTEKFPFIENKEHLFNFVSN